MVHSSRIERLSTVLQTAAMTTSAKNALAGDTGLEPVHGGIKIRCLTNLANPQQNKEPNF